MIVGVVVIKTSAPEDIVEVVVAGAEVVVVTKVEIAALVQIEVANEIRTKIAGIKDPVIVLDLHTETKIDSKLKTH